MIKASASVAVTTNRVSLYGADLRVEITRRKVSGGVRVRITATRLNYRTEHLTQSSFRDFSSAEEAAKAFNEQSVRWHNYTQASAIRDGYATAA